MELAELEVTKPGYCSRIRDIVVGRIGFGSVKFLGETDVRGLDLVQIVKFNRHEVIVYEDDNVKPDVGEGLNKPAIVTLHVKFGELKLDGDRFCRVVDRLRDSANKQGAEFISYNPLNGEWKFKVEHFSRFGLSLDDEDDIVMDDADEDQRVEMNDGVGVGIGEVEGFVNDGIDIRQNGTELSHSLPAHLGLDPARMREMKMFMFSGDGGEDETYDEFPSREKQANHREKFPLHNSGFRVSYKPSPPPPRKTPVPLLEYKSNGFDVNAAGTLLLAQQHKSPLKVVKSEGFRLDGNQETPVSGYHSRNIVDAGLFMGRSFRVGWGPNGVLIHSGVPVCSNDHQGILSSVITIEKVAIDKVTRDESNEVKKEAVELLFKSPLELHNSLNHRILEAQVGSLKLSLRKVVCDRFALSDICRSYIEVVEKQLEVSGMSASVRVSLMHQVIVWELIKVLFSERETSGKAVYGVDHDEDMMLDGKASGSEIDSEALPLMRRAEFSYWLQESVYHRVQEDSSCLSETDDLEQIFLFLTGRQLDAAVELAASRGDVRLACLLGEAGGSMVNRSDIAQQVELWRINGMDFNFIEEDRIRLYELLSGHIHSALSGKSIDWKRFLGLLMWYELPPGTALPAVFRTYQHLLTEGKAPYPVPVYIDEGPVEETVSVVTEGGRYDLAYYLMLLHASEDGNFDGLKSMFSAFASTNDPLDHHMIWHQRGILEAIGAFSSSDLYILDMAYVSQLLCLGQCHWAIYAVLHMPYCEDFPYLHATVIREILFRYCEIWSSQEEQRKFIEEMDVPAQWLHEAMVHFTHSILHYLY
ncbi:Nuclear pore complex protein NUP96 [Bienertia sinuspersici]